MQLARSWRAWPGSSKATGLEPPTRGWPRLRLAFADVPEYATADVALVAGLGLMSGYSEQNFRPWSGAKRGQVALAMSRYLDLPDASGRQS